MRFVIGIDLGTTNSCAAYTDTTDPKLSIQPFRIPQLTTEGVINSLTTLPSFCYLTAEKEFPNNSLDLPWKKHLDFFVGAYARDHGFKVPTRLVQSAKSWLCHTAANRRDPILPFETAENGRKVSPVEACSRYLSHFKEAWNHLMAQGDVEAEFEQQEIILTVPASFDEVARTLTVEAAKRAGFLNMTLLEEPQAAFYSWISHYEGNWQNTLKAGDTVVVCDVGGGTTDFSLIEVSQDEKGFLTFSRMAVGDHLLLGGDNMDAAVAHYLESKLTHQLNTNQWLQLCHEARRSKEILLGQNQEIYRFVLQGTGSSVVQGTISLEITKDEIQNLLLNGFFSVEKWSDAINLRATTGIRSMGLPYEDEPSITKHLARFLQRNNAKPQHLLFNGGAMKPQIFQKAIVDSMEQWFEGAKVTILNSSSLDLAVSRGAAYYGKVRRGLGVRIGGGTSRGYYLGVDAKQNDGKIERQALTLIARGSDEESCYEPDQNFHLIPNTPVTFQLYSSNIRLHDRPGDLIGIDPSEMQLMPPIHTILRFGKKETSPDKISVGLKAMLSAIGTLEIALKSYQSDHKWALEFQLRNSSGQEDTLAQLDETRKDETFSESHLKEACKLIHELFSQKNKHEKIMEVLETLLEQPRKEWSLSLLRGLGDALLKESGGRKQSQELEARWWNLAGFLLRPGYGYPLDDFRMKELWKIVLADFNLPKSNQILIQQWICFRRISGGLNKGQQTQIASDLIPQLFQKKGRNDEYIYSERIRAFASLELIQISHKIKAGSVLLKQIVNETAIDSDYWALSRLGARHLLYGTAVNVIPQETCSEWVKILLKCRDDHILFPFLISQLARKTDHRELNLPQTIINEILEKFPSLLSPLSLLNPYSSREKEQIFGDNLPAGLIIS